MIIKILQMRNPYNYSTTLVRRITAILLCFPILTSAQDLDFLEKSTSEDVFTSHNFFSSIYHDGHFYVAGEFWKDISFGEFSLSLPVGVDDTFHSFILKLKETGEVVDLWHFESEQYSRINELVINPATETLCIIGQYRSNLIYDGVELVCPYFGNGFIMDLSLDGSLNWSRELESTDLSSFSSGEAMAINEEGKIFTGFVLHGTVSIEDKEFSQGEEMSGGVLLKMDSNGTLLNSQQWFGNTFENILMIDDIVVDESGDINVASTFSGSLEFDDSLFYAVNNQIQGLLVRQTNEFELKSLNTFSSTTSNTTGLLANGNGVLLALQYRNFVELEDTLLVGSGSWGDLAIISIDEEGKQSLVRDFRLTENGGTSGVYARDLTFYDDRLFIGGFYQGTVETGGEVILGENESGNFQYPYIISMNVEGDIESIEGFDNSQGFSNLATLAISDHRLLFTGHFFQSVTIQDQTVQTVNSTLFYGALWDGVVNNTTSYSAFNEACNLEIRNSLSGEVLDIELHDSFTELVLLNTGGQVLKTLPTTSQSISINELPQGVYFLVAECVNGRTVKKITR